MTYDNNDDNRQQNGRYNTYDSNLNENIAQELTSENEYCDGKYDYNQLHNPENIAVNDKIKSNGDSINEPMHDQDLQSKTNSMDGKLLFAFLNIGWNVWNVRTWQRGNGYKIERGKN